MTDDTDAVLTDDRGRPLLRFERMLAHTPERVWRAPTEPGELAAWHPSPFELEPVVGGAVSYGGADDGEAMPDGEITEYDPPRALAYSWGEDLLRFDCTRVTAAACWCSPTPSTTASRPRATPPAGICASQPCRHRSMARMHRQAAMPKGCRSAGRG